MKKNFLVSVRLTFVCLIFFCGVYTLSVLGIAQLVPENRSFSKKETGYYKNVGQAFTSPNYFHGRPSAVDYNAAGSGGSNKGPSNPDYLAEVQTRIDSVLSQNPGTKKEDIPSDLVTASGSGIDPHISVQAALLQAIRVANNRQLPESRVAQLIQEQTQEPWLGLFGTKKINVLQLNLALDQLKK